jgi:hypothetical protein
MFLFIDMHPDERTTIRNVGIHVSNVSLKTTHIQEFQDISIGLLISHH